MNSYATLQRTYAKFGELSRCMFMCPRTSLYLNSSIFSHERQIKFSSHRVCVKCIAFYFIIRMLSLETCPRIDYLSSLLAHATIQSHHLHRFKLIFTESTRSWNETFTINTSDIWLCTKDAFSLLLPSSRISQVLSLLFSKISVLRQWTLPLITWNRKCETIGKFKNQFYRILLLLLWPAREIGRLIF